MIKFQKRKTYYPFPVYEFNLPTGHSCPHARDCLVRVDRFTGKFTIIGKKFFCYASKAERFPAVRKSRWMNLEAMRNGEDIVIPKDATHIRIHGSGDFFSQEYFDKWMYVAQNNPKVRFWAFTKSITFWCNRLQSIPSNFTLQASRGSDEDYKLKYAEVFSSRKDVPPSLEIDYDDSHAMTGDKSFALLDNNKNKKKAKGK